MHVVVPVLQCPAKPIGRHQPFSLEPLPTLRVPTPNAENTIFYNRVFRFTVDKAFRGVEAKEVEVLTGSGGGELWLWFSTWRSVRCLRLP